MKKPYKKRVKLGADGLFYPQFRWYFIWMHYDAETIDWMHPTTAVALPTLYAAQSYLARREEEDWLKVQNHKAKRVIAYSPKQESL